MSEQIVMCCEAHIEGILTAIYDAFVLKKQMTQPYEDNISIAIGDSYTPLLFAREIPITTDPHKAQKTVYAITHQLGFSVYHTIFHALCHYDEERATMVLGYLVRAFAKGSRISEYLTDPYVVRVMELSRKVGNEVQKMKGFLRFRDAGAFLFSQIEPKCDQLPLLQDHFEDRYPRENFVIYDAKREYAMVHPAGKEAFFVYGSQLERFLGELLGEGKEMLHIRDDFEALWKQYFATMAIDARQNERCQNNLLPKWYRKNMLEFDQTL